MNQIIIDKFKHELTEENYRNLATTLLLNEYQNIEKALGVFKKAYKKGNKVIIEFENGELIISRKEVLLNLKRDLSNKEIEKIVKNSLHNVKRELVFDKMEF